MLARLRNLQHLRRPAGLALFLAGLAAILWATLRHGDSAAFEPVPVTCLVCGRWGAVDVWRNVVLFAPMGAGLALLGVRPRVAALFGLALSLAVETSQATVLVGRTASLSDLLTNTLGAALGAFLTHRWRAWTLPSPLGARWLTAAAAGAWMAALALTGVGL
ncbi:MAG TPA: VanZ family protein, partial [Gemmatimonadales bacterium]